MNLVITPGISNSNELSNEDSTNNDFSINNIYTLNRYSGSDKMDNSKRITYGLSAYTDILKSSISQSYEFTDNNNFHKESQSDLIIQINELQNVIIQKSNDYKLLSFEYENIKREMDLTLNSLKEYKKLTFEQNKEILRAMKIIKRKKFIN